MKKGLFLVLLGLSVFLTAVHAAQADGCNRHYQSAVKFVVDTPVVHPFSINNRGASVIFSSGNLQYCPARDEWRFALRQFDRVGKGKSVYAPEGLQTSGNDVNDNGTTVFYDSIDYSTKDNTPSGFKEIKGVPCNNTLISKTYKGWIDMFAWGTSGNGRAVGDANTLFFYPYELSSENLGSEFNAYGYGPSFVVGRGAGATSNDIDTNSGTNRYFDWGYRNPIREYYDCVYDENNKVVSLFDKDATMYRPGIWRTLTIEEWEYILIKRVIDGKDSAFTYVRLKYGKNTTDTVSGVLIYPDDFSFAEVGVATMPFGANYPISEIDRATWDALEEAGCVFLPNAYQSYPNEQNQLNYNDGGLGQMGFYWSSTASDGAKAEYVRFDVRNKAVLVGATNRMDFINVRLVQDYTLRDPSPAAFSISATQKVQFSPGNLQYRANPATWRFAPQQFHRCMADNSKVSSSFAGWIDLFGWGTSGLTGARAPYYTNTTNTNYSWSEWGGNQIGRYPMNTWRTLSKDDWEYLINTRKVNGEAGYSFVHLQYSSNPLDTVTGIILYPDDFTWEKAGVKAIAVGENGADFISKTTWDAMEKVGCVFLPGCANRGESGGATGINGKNYGIYINYWTSTPVNGNNNKAYRLDGNVKTQKLNATQTSDRKLGYAVRLVRNL